MTLPTIGPQTVKRQYPIELQRQVHISTGSLGFFGVLLGLTVSPWIFAIPLIAAAGLMVAGVTGFCPMARLLARAPWNRTIYGKRGHTLPLPAA